MNSPSTTKFVPRPNRRGKKQIKINCLTFSKLIRALIDGDMTYQELADETGLHYVSILRYCRALRQEGAVYIAEWRSDARGNATLAVPKLGTRRDAPKPVKSRNEISRAYRARKAAKQLIQLTAGRMG